MEVLNIFADDFNGDSLDGDVMTASIHADVSPIQKFVLLLLHREYVCGWRSELLFLCIRANQGQFLVKWKIHIGNKYKSEYNGNIQR